MAAQDSVLTQIARPYASALFDIANSSNSIPQVEAGLTAIASLAADSQDFSRFLRSPVINADQKATAIQAIHERYLEAGADVVETDSFGASKLVLAEFDIAHRTYELSRAAAEVGRAAALRKPSPNFAPVARSTSAPPWIAMA